MQAKSYTKRCKKCNWKEVIKFWIKRWRQRYKCKICNHIFCNSSRIKKINTEIYKDFSKWKQTYTELSKKYKISIKTVQKRLDEYILPTAKLKPQEIVLLIDTTYFWDIWVMAFKDSKTKDILKIKLVNSESYASYKYWVEELIQEWWKIKAIVCDWKRWLLWWFENIPTQMCNYHQLAIVTRYITKRPRLEANKELRNIALLLTKTDKETFEYELNNWYVKYSDFLKEKALDENWKAYYIYKRTRSAYFSLKRNLKYLFIWYDYIWKLDIPNTTNWLEWFFSHLKTKVRIHRWLKKERKIKLIFALINQHF